MKVYEIMKKFNGKTVQLPVYFQEGLMGEPRKVVSFDFGDYYYEEKYKTVMSVDLCKDKVVIYYK